MSAAPGTAPRLRPLANVCVLVYLPLALCLVSPQAETAAEKVQVSLSLPWGRGDGAAGRKQDDLGWSCPTDFDVDSEGHYWILDTENYRALRVAPSPGAESTAVALPRDGRPEAIACLGSEVVVLEGRFSVKQRLPGLRLLMLRVGENLGDTSFVPLNQEEFSVPPLLDALHWAGAERHSLRYPAHDSVVVVNEISSIAAVYDPTNRKWGATWCHRGPHRIHATAAGFIYRVWEDLRLRPWSVYGQEEHLDGKVSDTLQVRIPAPSDDRMDYSLVLLGKDLQARWIVALYVGNPRTREQDLRLYAFGRKGETVGEVSLAEQGIRLSDSLGPFRVRVHKLAADGNVYLCLPTESAYRIARVDF